MRLSAGLRLGSTLVVGATALIAAAPASATTFCVPSFHPACPNNGSNVQQASLETAMQTNGDDTVADRIVIAAGTVTDVDTYKLLGGDNDDLEIVGAGPAATAITTTQSGNPFVINLSDGARAVTMRDLTIRIPASFADNLGAGIQAQKDTFDNVDIESRNPRSDGAPSLIGGSVFRDGRIYGSMGGSIDMGLKTNGAASGELLIERTAIEDASWGVTVDTGAVVTRVKRTRIVDPLAYGVRITNGGFAVVDNSIIEADTATPVVAESNDAGTVIATVRHTTIVGPPGDQNEPAVKAKVQNAIGNGSINLVVTDTIIAGYDNPLWCEAPAAANIGNASLTVRYSYFSHSAIVSGDCTLSNPNTIDALDPQVGPPQFVGAGNFHLPAGSPAIDSGDPLTVTLPTEDFDGAPRPVDGNADGNARRDMGAFEFQPPVPPGGDPPPGDPPPGDPPPGDPPLDPPPGDPPLDPTAGDTQAPLISKLKAKHGLSEGEGGIVKLRLSEPATVNVAVRPTTSRRGAKGALKLSYAGAAGKNKLPIKPGRLDAGSYKLKAIATDAAGNRSKPARIKLVVKP
jgi:hypothetical protein